MSRSLSRIRNLVSEIEEIHKQGQHSHSKSSEPEVSVEHDPFQELAESVHLESESTPAQNLQAAGKITMTLSGAVSLQVLISESGEVLELKQVGDHLEIRFSDGKAFHLPLKAVA